MGMDGVINRWHRARLALVCSAALAGIVFIALLLALFDQPWRDHLEKFQVALGGLGALAAALVAWDGSTAMAREARRKDERDREELRRRLIIQTGVNADHLASYCQKSAERLRSLSQQPFKAEDLQRSLMVFVKNRPLDDAWANISLFAGPVIVAMERVWTFSQGIQNSHMIAEIHPSTEIASAESVATIITTLDAGRQAAEHLRAVLQAEIDALSDRGTRK